MAAVREWQGSGLLARCTAELADLGEHVFEEVADVDGLEYPHRMAGSRQVTALEAEARSRDRPEHAAAGVEDKRDRRGVAERSMLDRFAVVRGVPLDQLLDEVV